MRLKPVASLCLILCFWAIGCGVHAGKLGEDGMEIEHLQGKVFGGQQPIAGATVQLWMAGHPSNTGETDGMGASTLGSAVLTSTDGQGTFSYGSFSCPTPAAPVYLTASGGNPGFGVNANSVLAASLGPCSGVAAIQGLVINEVTTVATAYAMSHYFTTGLGVNSTDAFGAFVRGNGYNLGLTMANQYTVPVLVNLATGRANANQVNGTLTISRETAKLNHLANILAACINSAGQTSTSETTTNCGRLFADTTPPGGTTRPSDTLQAAVQMALYPYQNVGDLYMLPPAASPFSGLGVLPGDWTLAVSYTSSDFGLGVSGVAGLAATSSNLDIDSAGNVWFPTNSAGSHGIGEFLPSTGSFAGPYATGLTRPQYVAINGSSTIYGTDYDGSAVLSTSVLTPTTASLGSVAVAATGPIAIGSGAGTGLSGGELFTSGTTLYSAYSGSVHLSTGITAPATAVVGGDAGSVDVQGYIASTLASGTCLAENPYKDNIVTLDPIRASAGPGCASGGILSATNQADRLMAASGLNQVCSFNAGACFTPPLAVTGPQGMALDGDGNVWVANAGNASVSTFVYKYGTQTIADYRASSTVQYSHAAGNGGTIVAPYGLAIDRSGNVWLSNAGCTTSSTTACSPGPYVLSEIIGAAAPTTTPLSLQELNGTSGARPIK